MKRLPAEWEKQEKIIVTFPHTKSDWSKYIEEITISYIDIINTISKFQEVVVLCYDKKKIKSYFKNNHLVKLIKIKTNDTWIRDYGVITLIKNNKKIHYNFKFNSWGNKFDYSLDNQVNQKLYEKKIIQNIKNKNFILEGGSIDSNGKGSLLTTTKCLLNKNRNKISKKKITKKLKSLFNLKKVLWLKNGGLIGDDTDSHIDTIARFISKDTIAYVKCYDKSDIHYKELNKMEKELKKFNYNLLPIPLPTPQFYKNKRLPATYLNFLFVNNAIIVPIYNDIFDNIAIKIFKHFFKNNKKVVTIDSSILIREYGSLHCATMQI